MKSPILIALSLLLAGCFEGTKTDRSGENSSRFSREEIETLDFEYNKNKTYSIYDLFHHKGDEDFDRIATISIVGFFQPSPGAYELLCLTAQENREGKEHYCIYVSFLDTVLLDGKTFAVEKIYEDHYILLNNREIRVTGEMQLLPSDKEGGSPFAVLGVDSIETIK